MIAMSAIFLAGFVFALMQAPDKVCEIEGTIQSVEFIAAHNETCVSTSSCSPGTVSRSPDEYNLNVLINRVSCISKNETDATESVRYTVGESKSFTILKTNVNTEFKEDQTIRFESNPYLNLFNSYEIIDEDEELMGSSCGTVTPGENNECCINKGYSGWDSEKSKCVGQNETEDNENNVLGVNYNGEDERECEAWKCTQWSACLNGNETRKCVKTLFNCTTDSEKPKLTKSCSEKEKFGFDEKLRDCPEECVCSGSTIKCTFENGTRVMTIYAGKSGNVIVQIKDLNMSTNVTLYKNEEGKVYGTFKGNKTHEIKLPDDVKEKLENKTKIKYYNESINLTEDGYYIVEMNKKSRLFFIFPVREHTEAEFNAETGETVKIRNPWWGFLARDVKTKEQHPAYTK